MVFGKKRGIVMQNKNTLFLGVVVAGCLSLNAAAINMKQAVQNTVSYNPSYLSAQSSFNAVQQGENIARAALLPQMQATASLDGMYTNPEGLGSIDRLERYSTSVGTGVSQVIFDKTKSYNLSETKANIEVQEIELENTKQSLIFNAINAYVTAYKEARILNRQMEYERVLKQQYDAVVAQVQVGELISTDQSLSEAAWRGATAQKAGALANHNTAKATFLQITGLPAEKLAQPYSAQHHLPKLYGEALTLALSNSPTLIASQKRLEAQKVSLKKAKAARYPVVTGSISAGYTDIFHEDSRYLSSSEGGTFQANGGIEVNVPIFSGGAITADIEAQQANLLASELTVENMKNVITEQLSAAWQAYLAAKEQKRAFQTQILASQKSVNGVKEEYAVGARSLIDVLNEETSLINAFVNYENAYANEIVASWRILQIIGTLDANRI